jgi:hypothetical protein
VLYLGVNYGRKKFYGTGTDVIKLFLSVIYRFSYLSRVFVRLG